MPLWYKWSMAGTCLLSSLKLEGLWRCGGHSIEHVHYLLEGLLFAFTSIMTAQRDSDAVDFIFNYHSVG
jgi:hypothetical protein